MILYLKLYLSELMSDLQVMLLTAFVNLLYNKNVSDR